MSLEFDHLNFSLVSPPTFWKYNIRLDWTVSLAVISGFSPLSFVMWAILCLHLDQGKTLL